MWTSTNKRGADTVFALVAWELWKERNARCFRGAATQLHQLLAVIKHKAEQWVHVMILDN
jgi:predicted negative regulator of RcsB-dependent stress response